MSQGDNVLSSWSEFTQRPDFYLWLLLLGIILLTLAAALLYRKISLLKRCHSSIGELVLLDKRSALEGHLWYARIAFKDQASVVHEVEFTGSGPHPRYARTGKLKVYYDPLNPKKAYSGEMWRLWSLEMAFSLLAGLFLWAAWVNY